MSAIPNRSAFSPRETLSRRSNGVEQPRIVYRSTGDNQGGTAAGHPPLFSGIVAGDYTGISAAARAKEFARGEMLHFEGDPVGQILLLTSGSVKITQLGQSGAEVILRLVVPGDVIGAPDLFSAGKHCSTAQAFRTCRALVWDARAFKALVERFPVLHQNMVRILGQNLLELEERFREVATARVGPRVARQLVRLREKIGRLVNGEIEIGLSREELAQMTGTTLFTVSRLLSAWEARGMVKPGREAVTICDLPSLRAISDEG
jgi:CRP-like cAMP-binding protein